MSRVYRVIVILFIWSVAVIDSRDETRFVSVVFRHGDRAPDSAEIELFPKDVLYLNCTFHPEGVGGLTNEGKRREYKLGQMLRERYNDFLGGVYVPEDVEARSTDFGRTKMSLQLVLAGLYPPAEIQRWSSDINWQPIPTSYSPVELDHLFFAAFSCPKYADELNRVASLPEVAKIIKEFRPIMERFRVITGKPIKSLRDMWRVYHGLMAQVSMNLPLAKWTTEFFPNGTLLFPATFAYEFTSWNNLLKRLNGGMLLKRMTDDMKSAANGTSTGARKINLFSGHEINVAALLVTLGLYKPHVPEFSSAVVVELFRRDNVDYVKIAHYLGIPPEFDELEIPNCGKLCPLDKFIELMREVTPSDVKLECKPDSDANPRSSYDPTVGGTTATKTL